MKNTILYTCLAIAILLMSCKKEEGEGTVKPNEPCPYEKCDDYPTNSNDNTPKPTQIQGKWQGLLKCEQCCHKEYIFDLDVDAFDKSTEAINANLKISVNNDESVYAKFKTIGKFKNNNILEVQTYEIIEENSPTCYFCKENQYEFVKQSDKVFIGTWKYSSNCDTSLVKKSSIILTKQ